MKSKRIFNSLIAVAIALVLLSTACSKSNPKPNVPTPVAVTGVVLTTDVKFGSILTDNAGRSLYFFSKDAATTSTCVGGCVVTWPVFYQANPSIGTGLTAGDFTTITRTDGTKQTAYKGWPLYYYMGDSKKGDVTGDAIGSVWFVGKADYSVMVSNAQLVGLDGVNYNDQGVAGTGASMYITDPAGRTLYLFSHDTHDTNVFTKSDFSNDAVWPIDQVSTVGSIPSTLDKTQFSVITVFGKSQLVYKGHPMYYFGGDNSVRGSTKGVSVPTPGAAIWNIQNNNTPVL
jgi:predicted lipoprotein with Yx(FWY)xxD motif